MNPAEVVYKIVNKARCLSNKVSLDKIMKIAEVSKKFLADPKNILPGPTTFGTGITLTNDEIKNIVKVIKSLENRGILSKGTTKKINIEEGGSLNFLRSLMMVVLPLMRNVLTTFSESLLDPLGLSAGMSAVDAAIQKTVSGAGIKTLIILRNRRHI